MINQPKRISIVTPTFRRHKEVVGLLENLCEQTLLPMEIVLVDGAPAEETETAEAVKPILDKFPFAVKYIRHGGGTAIQRNVGIDAAQGDYIAFVDDDVRLDAEFFERIVGVFASDAEKNIGAVVGYRMNQHFKLEETERWRWYRRLNLLSTYEPGRYDFKTGYPINSNLQPPFEGVRAVDFMTTACAVWRREVVDGGLRFNEFFRDYGVLEDAHFSLRAGRDWKLVQCGDALCEEMHSPNGRVNRRLVGYKSVVNYYFVFQDIAGPLTLNQKIRFWRYQAFEIFRLASSVVRRRSWNNVLELRGRLEGFFQVARGVKNIRSEK